jgi:hypothetical protein
MIRLFVNQTDTGFECSWKHSGEKWTGKTIQDALQAFELAYLDYYGRRPIYHWQ